MANPYEWTQDGRERRYDPREQQARRAEEDRRRGFEAEAAQLGRDVGRDWRRLSHGVRHAFEDERAPDERDPRRGGGMFGGQDRPSSLFSHDDGLSARPVGPNRGKGPRDYVRGDDRILEEACDRLSHDGRLDAREIELKVEAGEVTLNGQVKSREDKRRAEDLVERVSGVKHLQNNLRVRPPPQPAQPPAPPKVQPGVQPASMATGEEDPPQPPGARIAPPPTPRPH